MRHHYPTPLEIKLKKFYNWVHDLCVALANNEYFFLALLLDCLALVILWFVGLM
jgi:hypothetical protein